MRNEFMEVENRGTNSGDPYASIVLETFARLPKKLKPQKRSESVQEWTILAGILFEKEGLPLKCISCCTGLKCLPAHKVRTAQGRILHDCHAEILAIRALNAWLIETCGKLTMDPSASSAYVVRNSLENTEPPFKIRDEVKIVLYCSQAPCGDASMELVMQKQKDDTPWSDHKPASDELLGRGYFDRLGIVRRKPGRSDAPSVLSKSCSDKLSMKQCTSLLSSSALLLLDPGNAYLSKLVVPTLDFNRTSYVRAFGFDGRMKRLNNVAVPLVPFEVITTNLTFNFDRNQGGLEAPPCNSSTIWTENFQESIVGGVIQGRKASDPKGASRLSRLDLLRSAFTVLKVLDDNHAAGQTYHALKSSNVACLNKGRIKSKVISESLHNWTPNERDDDFSISAE